KPHNMTMTVTGAAMLWVGWFGFNAGSALAADGAAGMAMLVTHIAAATGAMAWAAVEALQHRRASALGVVSGAVAGLVAITPAAGNVGPMGAIALGGISGLACYWSVTVLKIRLGYDDSLDAFGVHGIGGIVGAVLTGLFAMPLLGGTFGAAEADAAATWGTAGTQVWWQTASVLVTLVWSGVLSFMLLKIVGVLTGGLRVSDESEQTGLDLSEHEEQGYIMS
ncbi:MAG: ammonium transporter, partial [Planctomycetota bacterium]